MDRSIGTPLTATGVALATLRPLPSWPFEPSPQHHAWPTAVRPQAWVGPTLMARNACPPATLTGAWAESPGPKPSCPARLSPQHTAPFEASAQDAPPEAPIGTAR